MPPASTQPGERVASTSDATKRDGTQRFPGGKDDRAGRTAFARRDARPKGEEKILFQRFFKSVGPRTYAAQVKEAGNGNHALVLIEGKRDAETGEVKKHKLYLWSEDFPAFMDMFEAVRTYIAEHPVSEQVRARQEAFWKNGGKRRSGSGSPRPKFAAKRA